MEIKLNDNSHIRFERTQRGELYIELLRPTNIQDKNSYAVIASAFIYDQELADLVTAISSVSGANRGANSPLFAGISDATNE
jgi:hypothetical protein